MGDQTCHGQAGMVDLLQVIRRTWALPLVPNCNTAMTQSYYLRSFMKTIALKLPGELFDADFKIYRKHERKVIPLVLPIAIG
jgi:hypothetical protein